MTKEDEVKKQLKWRLSEKPTVESIEKLLSLGVIDKDEAKQILLDEDEVKPKSFIDLQKEVELLRELVLDIAKREPRTKTIIERHFDHTVYRPWKWDYIGPVYYTSTGSINSFTASSCGLTDGATINMSAVTDTANMIK